jgi:Na+/phosphate symporter
MQGRRSFKNPLRSLGHGHDTKDFEVQTLHKRPVSNSVGVEEGLMLMTSKLVEMTRVLAARFSGFPGSDPETCSRLAEEVREQSQVLIKELVSMRGSEGLIDGLIRLSSSLERVGHMLENILDAYRTETPSEIIFSDNTDRERKQILVLLLDILTNLRDAVQNPSREALLAVLLQGKRLEQMIRDSTGTHWERVKLGVCPVDASAMGREILDSAKWANEYLMEVASTLLELGGAPALTSAQSGTALG